jgi:hypothetical protein
MNVSSHKTSIGVTLNDSELAAIDEWRSASNWPNREAAIRHLLKLGLETPPDAAASVLRRVR